jgi:hypothetical protein
LSGPPRGWRDGAQPREQGRWLDDVSGDLADDRGRHRRIGHAADSDDWTAEGNGEIRRHSGVASAD